MLKDFRCWINDWVSECIYANSENYHTLHFANRGSLFVGFLNSLVQFSYDPTLSQMSQNIYKFVYIKGYQKRLIVANETIAQVFRMSNHS